MRFAISIPQFTADGEFDPGAFRAYLRRAEELGFHSGWTQEQFFGRFPSIAPLEAMTFAAACTETLRLGCSVFVTPLHNPVHLAKALASLDQLSRGRVEVGIGTGGRGRPFPAFGVHDEAIVARFLEGLEVVRALWTQPEVTFDGRFWRLAGEPMEPKPFQKPGPPVWFGFIGGAEADRLDRAPARTSGRSTTSALSIAAAIVKRNRSSAPGETPAA